MESISDNETKYTHKRKIKNYLISPRIQGSLITFNILALWTALGIIYYHVVKSFWVMDEMARTASIPVNSFYYETVGFQRELIISSIVVAAILSTVLAILFTILFTHKSLGAVHRLKSYFEDIRDNGHQSDLSFRDGDLHDEIPQIVNDAIKKIKES